MLPPQNWIQSLNIQNIYLNLPVLSISWKIKYIHQTIHKISTTYVIQTSLQFAGIVYTGNFKPDISQVII